EFEKQKERKQKALKEKEMDNAAYNYFETSSIREKQKQEEVKRLNKGAAETERNHIEE
ncbi:unnamed protein product, partial [Brassica napus]